MAETTTDELHSIQGVAKRASFEILKSYRMKTLDLSTKCLIFDQIPKL